MNDNEALLIVAGLTASEHKRFKKGVRLLCSIGMYPNAAIIVMAEAVKERNSPSMRNLYSATK